ncbi:MAG TPA: DUF2007 domain-containing protein [Saprospiraceae bacterium]|nr:DUF2007 domain-containing protein [Saprospiraceae bacterium]HMX87702.1 DUF2007 domain-containing protein [Saprospiraceae bacterium]HMZ39517.1 DUF2007 domain-containing protein [Saprospiraceae bacterium]HNA63110.1 DUF2007 domain-containing protein [Saprospiraceae bacterium]HNB29428.1 DUF2007 domain-containing protein [Saprospiraceae bacterium]
MQGWKKIMTVKDQYLAELKRILLTKNGIEAMLMNRPQESLKISISGTDLYVKEGQFEIASILLFENEED